MQRQLNIEMQSALAAKRSVSEHELRDARLQEQINLLQRDKDHLNSHISTVQQRVSFVFSLRYTAGLECLVRML